MPHRLLSIALFALCAGTVASCSHPVAPPPAVTISDTVTISAPNVGYVKDTISFSAHTNFNASNDKFKWIFSDSTITTSDSNLSRIFLDSGKNILHLRVLRDTTILCSILDTIQILDTSHRDTIKPPPNPNDTTSHNFVWTEYDDVNGENDMTGCWVFSANDIYAINGDLHHFDGTNWKTIVVRDLNGSSYQGALSGSSIFGFADNDIWFTGANLALHYQGNGFVKTNSTYYMNHGRIYSAWGTSSNDMYFAGDSGLIAHFDGTNWTKMLTPTTKNLYNISGTSEKDIWASGYNTSTGESELIHYNGSSWSKDSLSNQGITENWGLNSVYAYDSANYPSIAVCGWTVWQRNSVAGWRSDSSYVPNNIGGRIFMSIYGNNANDLLGAGDFGLVVHWNGKSWQRYDKFLSVGDNAYFHHRASINGNTACIVGTKDGASWVLIGQRQ